MTKNESTKESTGLWEALLGPSKEDVWRELSEEINSRIERGGFLESDKMMLDVGGSTVTLDTFIVYPGTHKAHFTRMRAPVKLKLNEQNSGLRFCITNQDFFADLAIKLFGAQDIQVQDAAFDKRFVIAGNDETKVRELLSSERIRALLLLQSNDIQFALKYDERAIATQFPNVVDELYLCKLGVVRDVTVLRSYFDLFAETLGKLKEMGLVSTENPC